MTDDVAPPKPSRLSLWMHQNGRPDQLRVEYRMTGDDTADTWLHLTITKHHKFPRGCSIEIRREELEHERWGNKPGQDVYLSVDHAFVCDWTQEGRKRLDAWMDFEEKNKRDRAEWERLKRKFGT